MCIIFVYRPSSSSKLALVVAMNREESFWRPTLPACWHDDLLAGWDMTKSKEFGTWLAINRQGDIAFLTNLFTNQMPDIYKRGRGNLATDVLKTDDPEQFMEDLFNTCSEYNPFNLGLLKCSQGTKTNQDGGHDGAEAINYNFSYLSSGADFLNRPELKSESPCSFNLVSGQKDLFAQSNHPPSEQYTKCKEGSLLFRDLVDKFADTADDLQHCELIETIFKEVLNNPNVHWPDPQILRQSRHSSESLEKNGETRRYLSALSSIFCPAHNGFGTRMQTVITVDHQGNVNFVERHRDNEAQWMTTKHQFNLHNASN